MVIALIAGLRPGTSPPPVRIAIVLLFAMPKKLAHLCSVATLHCLPVGPVCNRRRHATVMLKRHPDRRDLIMNDALPFFGIAAAISSLALLVWTGGRVWLRAKELEIQSVASLDPASTAVLS